MQKEDLVETENERVEAVLEQVNEALAMVAPFALIVAQVPDTDVSISAATDIVSIPGMISGGLLQLASEGADSAAVRSQFVRDFRARAASRPSGDEPDSQLRLHETEPVREEAYELWIRVGPDAPIEDKTKIMIDLMRKAVDLIDAPAMIVAGVPDSIRTISIHTEKLTVPDAVSLLAEAAAGRVRSRAQQSEMLGACLQKYDRYAD